MAHRSSGWIDISQPLTATTGHWPGDIPFSYALSATKAETGSVNIGKITTSLHTGTHIDAPYHFDDEGERVHELKIGPYIGTAKVIDVSAYDSVGKKELASLSFGRTARVLLRTRAAQPPPSSPFPQRVTHLREDIAPFLQERGIVLVGVDAPSVDPLDSKALPAHHALHRHGVHILENVVLHHVQPGDYELIALPLAIHGADGSPVRAVIRPLPDSPA